MSMAQGAPAEGSGERLLGVRRAVARLESLLDAERERWFAWVPVLIGAGIALYFSLPAEPWLIMAVATLGAALALRQWLAGRRTALAVLSAALLASALGFALAKLRAEVVAAPVLERRMGPVEVRGWVELVEPRSTRGERLTIRLTALGRLTADQRPRRARVRTMRVLAGLKPGDAVRLWAHLAPPAAPALPGAYDFARAAWFQGIGALGFALARPEFDTEAGPAPLSLRMGAAVEGLRQAIGARITAGLPGEPGAIANALVTGERGGISEETNAAFRDSGLLHVLSISGLHMAVMAGAVFTLVRCGLAVFPAVALQWPIKKWAASAAAVAALAYLMISGAAFATVRSYVMISIMFLAVLLDRPAIGLRNVALGALVILVLWPESLHDVGFQMSFAAVTALVSAYEFIRERARHRESRRPLILTLAVFFGGIVLSTLVASVAVAPFAAYHFHKSQQYAVVANLVAIPICNLIVMPAALATLLLMPFGLEALALPVMGWGIEGMLWCARRVAALPGAVVRIAAIPPAAFALMVAGGLWLLLWRTRLRLCGLVGIALGLALAPTARRPDILVGRDGQLVAVRGEGGQLAALPAPHASFELSRWLEHDGDTRAASEVVKAPGFRCDAAGCTAQVRGTLLAVARHPSAVADDCQRAGILVLAMPRPLACTRPRLVLDFFAVRSAGTHAIYLRPGGAARVETVAAERGDRPWSQVRTRARKPAASGAALADGTLSEHLRRYPSAGSAEVAGRVPLRRPEVEDEEDLAFAARKGGPVARAVHLRHSP